MSFANIITQMRVSEGWTQGDLAGRVPCSPSLVSQWESGIRQPASAMLGRLADIFGCSVDELLGREARK